MIGYTSLGTNDLNRSATFYDELFQILGIGRLLAVSDFIVWGQDMSSTNFSIHLPIDGKSASVGNGVMVALCAKNREEVDRVYTKALELGGTDEGQPGPRGDSGFYAGYFRDLDGNKLNMHCMT